MSIQVPEGITVEVYKADRRVNGGERLVRKVDHSTNDMAAVKAVYDKDFTKEQGYKVEYHTTYMVSTNLLTKEEFVERYDTPYACSPSSETFWAS